MAKSTLQEKLRDHPSVRGAVFNGVLDWYDDGGNVDELPAELKKLIGGYISAVIFGASEGLESPEARAQSAQRRKSKPGPKPKVKGANKKASGGRKKMSKAQREEVSERMRAYWAERRKTSKK